MRLDDGFMSVCTPCDHRFGRRIISINLNVTSVAEMGLLVGRFMTVLRLQMSTSGKPTARF